MKISRKAFLRTGIFASAAFGLSRLNTLSAPASFPALNLSNSVTDANDESFWKEIRAQFCTSTNLINLNNAALSPQPVVVQQEHYRNDQYSNEGPSYFMWEKLDSQRENLRNKLAIIAGCEANEIAISRNATEALNSIIYGIDLKRGDEVVLSDMDYPFMINAWKQRAQREGIQLKFVALNSPEKSDRDIIKKYKTAISPNTKVLHLTHMINWNGQILPVEKLVKIAHKYGCKVIVDAAHSFGHLPHSIRKLNADYYAASLHKWMCSPFGTGLLHIKKENISNTWPLHSAYDPKSDDIRKFEFLGSRSFAAEMTIAKALEFHEQIGTEIKYKRLSLLKNYWIDQVSDLKDFELKSPACSMYEGGAIAAFSLKNVSVDTIVEQLIKRYKIHVGKVNLPNLKAVRISPHIYTSKKELDILAKAIKELQV